MDVRIGVTYSTKEIDLDLGDADVDVVKADVDQALADAEGVLWLTDRNGRQVGVPTLKIAYIEIGSPKDDRRIGFSY